MTLVWRGPEVAAELARRADAAAEHGGQHLLALSNERVPDDPGPSGGRDLHDSGKVTTDRDGGGAVAAVSYGTAYAVLQHEVLYYDHAPGQRSKYLESAMTDDVPELRRLIQRDMSV